MTEDGTIYALTRGEAPRYGGGSLATLPMENLLADAEVEGIDDEFFVIVPDPEHHRCFVPYLFVVLNKGYTVDDIRAVSYTHLRAHETGRNLVCRLLLEKKKKTKKNIKKKKKELQ